MDIGLLNFIASESSAGRDYRVYGTIKFISLCFPIPISIYVKTTSLSLNQISVYFNLRRGQIFAQFLK